ncbi:MAG TPA: hypothetical protein PLB74_01160 [Candidatus Paceibacterota bacterium]|nr:hypothetical protein [Candidatus Paceibacterota bacterium]
MADDFTQQIIHLEKIRKRKKWAIFSIPILIIVLLVLIKVFFIKPAPTCFDGIKNGKEEGIDCGGPCLACGIKYAQPIEVVSTKILSETLNTSQVLIQIKNSNAEYGVTFDYTATLYSAFGEKLKTISSKDFILPFSTKYLLLQKIDIPAEKINRVEVNFNYQTKDWFYSDKKTTDLFSIPNKQLRMMRPDEAGFLEVQAQIKNNTNIDFAEVEIIILLFSKTGEIINAAKTQTFDVAAYSTRPITYVWLYNFPDSNILDLYHIEIIADAHK